MTDRTSTASIKVGDRHRKDMGDLNALAASIKLVGLLQPIGVTPGGELVFGERRLRACRDILGWSEIPARIIKIDSIVAGEFHENEVRKDFTPSERVAIERSINAELERRQGARNLSQNLVTTRGERNHLADDTASAARAHSARRAGISKTTTQI